MQQSEDEKPKDLAEGIRAWTGFIILAIILFGGLGFGTYQTFILILHGESLLGLLIMLITEGLVLTSGRWLAPMIGKLVFLGKKH